jgi:hypothetical protein
MLELAFKINGYIKNYNLFYNICSLIDGRPSNIEDIDYINYFKNNRLFRFCPEQFWITGENQFVRFLYWIIN